MEALDDPPKPNDDKGKEELNAEPEAAPPPLQEGEGTPPVQEPSPPPSPPRTSTPNLDEVARFNAADKRHEDARDQNKMDFLVELRIKYGNEVDSLEPKTDALLQQWHLRRAFLPSASNVQREFLEWLAERATGRKPTGFAAKLSVDTLAWDPVWQTVDAILNMRLRERMDVAAANAESTTGDGLAQIMDADRMRQRDFVRAIAALKRAQVDMTDETGAVTQAERDAQRLAYKVRDASFSLSLALYFCLSLFLALSLSLFPFARGTILT
jgi:hypothetical protein